MISIRNWYANYYEWASNKGVAHRKALNSFLEPILIRWRSRKVCFNCDEKVVIRCRQHGTRLCGNVSCKLVHRRNRYSGAGSLIRGYCEYAVMDTWTDRVLYFLAASTVGIFVAWIAVWL